ncbi:MAG: hypothetical protein AB1424_12775 [Thermodesulfobacteriota bacterium]
MPVYERPAILMVGADGKPAHLGAIIRFKAIDVVELTGKSVKELLANYEKGESKITIQFNIVDVVEAGTEKAVKLASKRQ